MGVFQWYPYSEIGNDRLVVLEFGLGLESGLESIFAGLGLGLGLALKGLGLETPGLGLGLGLGSFFLQVLCQVHL